MRNNIPEKDANLELFLARMRERFGARAKKVILFGSRARGESSPESDYDCLVIFAKLSPADRREIDELCAWFLIERAASFSVFAMEEEDLERLRFEPFIMNAQKEGIVLVSG